MRIFVEARRAQCDVWRDGTAHALLAAGSPTGHRPGKPWRRRSGESAANRGMRAGAEMERPLRPSGMRLLRRTAASAFLLVLTAVSTARAQGAEQCVGPVAQARPRVERAATQVGAVAAGTASIAFI